LYKPIMGFNKRDLLVVWHLQHTHVYVLPYICILQANVITILND
jgi:hypothetical protein